MPHSFLASRLNILPIVSGVGRGGLAARGVQTRYPWVLGFAWEVPRPPRLARDAEYIAECLNKQLACSNARVPHACVSEPTVLKKLPVRPGLVGHGCNVQRLVDVIHQ